MCSRSPCTDASQAVELVVTQPLVNILRGAMGVLIAVVSHPYVSSTKQVDPEAFGYRALRPSIAAFPQFLESLVNRLSSADHTLCANSLQLINNLMRDVIANGADNEWPKYIKKLQDLGVIRAVYELMQGSILQDLAQPLLEFQALTKILLRKWAAVVVDFSKSEHKRAIRAVYQASKTDKDGRVSDNSESYDPKTSTGAEKWKRLGFATTAPAAEFDEVGYLGMMDLSDFVRRTETQFQKLVLEQCNQTYEKRCPIARASIAVTGILYDHFGVEKADLDDTKEFIGIDSKSNIDKLFKPMLLQWSRLHVAGLQAFFGLWKSAGAELENFDKIVELVRILLEDVLGNSSRTRDITSIEDEIQSHDRERLRELQMELLEMSYEDTWRDHLKQVREGLMEEALQFLKEQRIRCLLGGQWFPLSLNESKAQTTKSDSENEWRFVRLSHNRRILHYADFESKESFDPDLVDLPEKCKYTCFAIIPSLTSLVDLSKVTSVVSNLAKKEASANSSNTEVHVPAPGTPTKIVINGQLPRPTETSSSKHHRKTSSSTSGRKEIPLLTLYPPNQVLAAEWLDGLLVLLNQPPITQETQQLLQIMCDSSLRVRLLNVKYEEAPNFEEMQSKIPNREQLDYDYYYDVFGTA